MSSDLEITVISGINYNGIPQSKRPLKFQTRLKAITNIISYFAPLLANYTFFLDDEMATRNPEQLAYYVMTTNSEMYVVKAKGRLLGFHILENIKPGRSAIWHAFFPTETGLMRHRHSSGRELLEHAFAEAPQGLGLIKVQAHITKENMPARRLIQKLFGAQIVGILKWDNFHRGVAYDKVIYEVYNPILTAAESPLNEVEPNSAQHDDLQSGELGERAGDDLHSDSGAELRRVGDATSDSDAPEQQAPDSGADDFVSPGGGQSLARKLATEWDDVRSSGEEEVGGLLPYPVPEPTDRISEKRAKPKRSR